QWLNSVGAEPLMTLINTDALGVNSQKIALCSISENQCDQWLSSGSNEPLITLINTDAWVEVLVLENPESPSCRISGNQCDQWLNFSGEEPLITLINTDVPGMNPQKIASCWISENQCDQWLSFQIFNSTHLRVSYERF
ncbi:MAG: hypothetical protein LAT83_09450, partial [Kiritimatiellae bacterium]|nr:hypothetical protein [Kiritimatiellia bacterium]